MTAVIAYDSVDEAVAIVNESENGLSGSVWTTDVVRGMDVARRIRTGQIRVTGAALATDAPSGGFKQSGIGRERGPEGLAAFLETKAILPPTGLSVAPAPDLDTRAGRCRRPRSDPGRTRPAGP